MRGTTWLAAIAAAGAALLAPVAALAWGALAISQIDTGAWSYGLSTQHASRHEAIEAATQLCRSERYGQNCRVVTTFNGLCIGVAFRDGGNGYGWATRRSEQEARSAAQQSCLETNPACTVAVSRCDTATTEPDPSSDPK